MDAVAEIKTKIPLAEYVGRSVQLTKSGRNLKGRCPFHDERTASFYVFPDRGGWRCFGACGEGGDVFSFVQRRDGTDFATALRELAREAGVELSQGGSQRRARGEQLSRLVSAAVDFYQRQLEAPDGGDAKEYLTAKRGLTLDTIAEWKLGFAPDDWRPLRDHLGSRGFDEADMLAAGLLVEPQEDGARESYDRFRNRVTIPLTDEHGLFVGMAGRSLHGEEPKYLNSPQTETFDKSRTLFGLDRAGAAIRESGTVVVVEGYTDVIGPWQAGFRNVVATMGTSLTEQHVGMLRRVARRVVLALDADKAGLAAAERAGDLFLSLASPDDAARSTRSVEQVVGALDLELRVASLPSGQDPDDVARENPALWESAVAEAPAFADFAIRRLLGDDRPESATERRRLVDRVRPVINAVRDPVERALYTQRVARLLGVAEHAVHERLRSNVPRRSHHIQPPVGRTPPSREELLLAILLRNPDLKPKVRSLPVDLFGESINREVFQYWLREAEEQNSEANEDDPVRAKRNAIATLRLPPLAVEEARQAASRSVEAILRERLIQRQAAVAEEIAEAEKDLGASHVAAVSHEAWLGEMPADEVTSIAQAVIEELELGLSIHRREAGDLV